MWFWKDVAAQARRMCIAFVSGIVGRETCQPIRTAYGGVVEINRAATRGAGHCGPLSA
jgi:hypothetical protein